MPKKLLAPLIIVIIAIAAGVIIWQHHNTDAKPVAHKQVLAQSSPQKPKPACAQDDTSLQISSSDRSGLETVGTNKLLHVPAGTQVNVNFNSYDDKTASGSVIYAGKYGHYNFKAVQTGKPQGITDDSGHDLTGGWKVTSFVSCES